MYVCGSLIARFSLAPGEIGQKQLALMVQVVRQQALVTDVGMGHPVGVHQDPLGVAQGGVNEGLETAAGQGGGEEQGLPLLVAGLDDLHHVRGEAHVEHAVGLVQDQELQVAQVRGAALQVVEQPPRGGDEDIRVAAQGVDLMAGGHSADDDPGGEAGEARHLEEVLLDLIGQLPGRRQDQGADALARGGRRQKVAQHGQEEGQGLPRAGGGGHQQVSAGIRQGDDLALHRGRVCEAQLVQAPQQGFRKVEGGKGVTHGAQGIRGVWQINVRFSRIGWRLARDAVNTSM